MTHRNLSIYLLVSVLLILAGITWIVLTQVDRGAYYSVEFPNLTEEHHALIQKIYQLPDEKDKNKISTVVEKPVLIPVDQAQPLTATALNPESEPSYQLRNNPWSPHYKPGNL
jgi:hypothetical protein